MHSSFKFYLSNEASNELLAKTKVVDLEILNNFGIQKLFIWGHVEGEKLSLQTRVLNFALFTKLPSLHLSSSSVFSLPHAVCRRCAGVGHLAGHAPRPGQIRLARPRYHPKPLALASPTRNTRPRRPPLAPSPSRRRCCSASSRHCLPRRLSRPNPLASKI